MPARCPPMSMPRTTRFRAQASQPYSADRLAVTTGRNRSTPGRFGLVIVSDAAMASLDGLKDHDCTAMEQRR